MLACGGLSRIYESTTLASRLVSAEFFEFFAHLGGCCRPVNTSKRARDRIPTAGKALGRGCFMGVTYLFGHLRPVHSMPAVLIETHNTTWHSCPFRVSVVGPILL